MRSKIICLRIEFKSYRVYNKGYENIKRKLQHYNFSENGKNKERNLYKDG